MLVAALVAATATMAPTDADAAGSGSKPRVLVFTRTTGFRHHSIGLGAEVIQALGERHGFAVDDTADPSGFTARTLRRYRALVFLSTTGNPVAQRSQRIAVRRFVTEGGGFVGIHAASDVDETSRASWPWFGRLVGAYFGGHPAYASPPPGGDGTCASCHRGVVNIVDAVHPAMRPVVRGLDGQARGAEKRWPVYDEFYGFTTNPRPRVHVLATLDERTYLDDPTLVSGASGTMGDDHPIAWCHDVGRGRSFYTGLGHADGMYRDDLFLRHLAGGIRWATGQIEGDCATTG